MSKSKPQSVITPNNMDILLSYANSVPKGLFIEVGVYKGGTAYRLAEIAKEKNNDIWLFDTFEGIPEKTDGIDQHSVGDFSDCSYEEVRNSIPYAKFFKGVFPETLPDEIPPIAFVHVDCDQYESVKACIHRLIPHMVTGGIMYFDDYGWLVGATKAVNEECPERFILANKKATYTKR